MAYGMSKWRDSAMSKARQLSDLKGTSHVKAATNAAMVQAGAAGAAMLDAKVGEIQGVKPSIAGGLVTATAGFLTRSPKLIYAASGALAPHTYNAVLEWASDDSATDEVAEDEDDG